MHIFEKSDKIYLREYSAYGKEIIMDRVVEKLVKKKRNAKDTGMQLLIATTGIIICYVANMFMQYLGMISMSIILLAIWFTYKGIMWFNIEYEYTYINGDMDVDKILGKNARRPFKRIELDRVVLVAKMDNNEAKKLMHTSKRFNVCENAEDEGNLVIIYSGEKDREAVVIDYNEEVYQSYKELIPIMVR